MLVQKYAWSPGGESEARIPTEISEPLLLLDKAAKTPGTPFALGLSRNAPARVDLLPAQAVEVLPELLTHAFGITLLNPIV